MAKRPSKPGKDGPVIYVPDMPGSKFADMDRYAVAIPATNSYAICVPYSQARSTPVHGDKVYVRRTRTADGKYEETLRTVRIKGKKVRLECEEPAPVGYRSAIIAYPSSRRSETVEIRGLVIGWYEPKAIGRGEP